MAAKMKLSGEVAAVMEKIDSLPTEQTSSIFSEEQKHALEEARACIEKLVAEYNDLNCHLDVFEQETFASTEFYEADIQKKKDLIQDLETKLEHKERELSTARKQWQQESQALATATKLEKAELSNRVNSLEAELRTLQAFKENKKHLEEQIEEAKVNTTRLVEKQQKELAEIERKYIEQGNRLKKDYDKNVEELHKKLTAEIEDRVGVRIKNILQENERLEEEIRIHIGVTNTLQKQTSDLGTQATDLLREIELLRQADVLHVQRNNNQSRLIAESTSKVQNLEKSLAQLVRQYGAERHALEEEHQKSLASFHVERQTMKRIIQTKTKELKKVRQLAQQVLQERGEVETFLIESLQCVVTEIKQLKRKSLPKINKGPTKAVTPVKQVPHTRSPQLWLTNKDANRQSKRPSITTEAKLKYNIDQTNAGILEDLDEVPAQLTPKVDISELTWEDREKVLRFLFTKINNAHQIPNSVALAHTRDKYYELYGLGGNDSQAGNVRHDLQGIVSDAGRVIV